MCDREYHLTAGEISAADAHQIATGRGRSGRKSSLKPVKIPDREEQTLELIGHKTPGQETRQFNPANIISRAD